MLQEGTSLAKEFHNDKGTHINYLAKYRTCVAQKAFLWKHWL